MLLEEGQQVGCVVVELLNPFGKDARAHVLGVVLAEIDHSLLADVLRALEAEDIGRSGAVPEEELGLELVLGEVLEDESLGGLAGEALDELAGDCLVILSVEALLLDERVEVDALHVGSASQLVGDTGLAACLGSEHEHALGEHCHLGLGVDFLDAVSGIDVSDLTELLVECDNWQRLVEIVLDSSLDGLSVVIGSSAGLSSLHASLKHSLLGHIVVQDLEGLDNVSLEVHRLIDSSGESINQIVLNN